MHDEGVISRHIEYMQLRNLRDWTVYGRGRALARLTLWAQGPVLYLTEQQLKEWQKDRAKQVEPESLRTDTSHLRQFYRWAQREGFRVDDPSMRLIMPRVNRRLPRPIADTLLTEAMAEADASTSAILALAAFAGLRACEIAVIDWSELDIDSEQPHLRADGKGGKQRHVPLSGALITVLMELPARKGPVIPRLDGKSGPNTSTRISKRANDYLHGIGITETLHQCRHRFATVTYRACKDIRAVQELLGHSSPVTTAIYAASASAVAIDAVERAGLLAS